MEVTYKNYLEGCDIKIWATDYTDNHGLKSNVILDHAQTTAHHDVATAVIRRRFDSGLRNFQKIYMELVDEWWWYDNSDNTPQLISTGRNER